MNSIQQREEHELKHFYLCQGLIFSQQDGTSLLQEDQRWDFSWTEQINTLMKWMKAETTIKTLQS